MTCGDIFLGDCAEILKTIPDKSVDLVVTDPPYIVATSGGGICNQPDKKYLEEIRKMSNGFSEEILELLCKKMKKINIYLFCSRKQIPILLDIFVKKHKCNWNLLSWHKTNPIPACGNTYLPDTEYVMFFRQKGVKLYGTYGTKSTYYVSPLNTDDKKKYGHPTIKPLNIVENFVVNSSCEGDVVLDPFLGSGTTAVAAVKHNRRFIGIELDEKSVEIAKRRIKEVGGDYK